MAKTNPRRRRSWTKIILWTIAALVVLFIAIQFVPYGRDHSNPPATRPFKWSDPQAETLAKKSCYDCHSNETKWWWATRIAPMSWLVQHDIDDAKRVFNFSEWSGALTSAEMSGAISDNMPPLQYTLIHPGAKLTDADKQALVGGFEASLGANQTAEPAPALTPTSSATSGAASSAADPTAIIEARCGACHSTAPAQQFRAANTADAQALLDQMIQQGATVTPAEQKALVSYFTR